MRRTGIRDWTELFAGAVHGSGKAVRALGLAAVLGAGLLLGACGGASTAGGGERAEAVVEETASARSMAVQAMAPAAEEMTDGAEYGLEYEQANDGGGMASGAEMESGTGDLSRKLIRDVTLEVETREFDSLLAQVSERVSELGGYMESSQVSGVSLNARGGARDRDASLKARIPADKLDSFLESVETEANVVSRQENVTDITLTYSDVESRKKSLEIEQERLWELLEQADSMDAVVALEARLSEVRYELESMTSKLRLYDNQVAYSTVDILIWEVGEYTPRDEESVGERIQKGFSDSLEALAEGAEDLVVWMASNSPILLVLAIAAFLLWRAGRLIRRLTGRRKKETGGRGPRAFGGKKKAGGEETPGEPGNKGESQEEKP